MTYFNRWGCLWRASKSGLVSKIRAAKKKEQRLKLKPDNVPSVAVWWRFIKTKTSAFKAKNEKSKAMRCKQMQHTTSRKGMVRLAIDMERKSSNPFTISRVKVWIKGHTKKDGTPVNSVVGEIIDKLNMIEIVALSSSLTNVREDALSEVLGKDKPGRFRAMGRGVTISTVSFLQARDKHVVQLKEENAEFRNRINQLETLVSQLVGNRRDETIEHADKADKSSATGVTSKPDNKCNLLDWCGSDDVVAQGHWFSSDPKYLVNHVPLGPNAMKVVIDIPSVPDAFLWWPTCDMLCMKQAQGKTIAWPADKVVFQTSQDYDDEDNMSTHSGTNMNHSRCKILDWTGEDEIVAHGRCVSSDKKMFVNGIPLGPKAMIVWVDGMARPESFLWRPTLEMTSIKDVIGSKIAWPSDRIVLENPPSNDESLKSSSAKSVNNSMKKCKLLDIGGSSSIVAEGHWSSTDPNELVHFVPLGPNAVRVWVDIPRISTAFLWRPTCELEYIEDVVGTTIAWPSDRVIML
ncbi:unnamed protein product [Cuscuta epithymum]|uniref:DUF8039 domain-containing protein n=1 Tax=Cuscuta epithymum TaxID=186058 RepID=A0AAV0GKC6_9ASTE|nr:unnamed protein product [Cuscuta epithymum]